MLDLPMEAEEVACVFCKQASSIYTLENLRKHLIDAHAKEALIAFLFPDMSKDEHIFLFYTVQFSVDAFENILQVPTKSYIDSITVKEEVDLSTFLDSTTESMDTAAEYKVDVDMTTPATETKVDDKVDIKDVIENTRLPQPDDIDISNISKSTCQLCWENAHNRSLHILKAHLKKSRFACPVCSRAFESSDIHKHLKVNHADSAAVAPISNVDIYRNSISHLRGICFPSVKGRITLSRKPFSDMFCTECGLKVSSNSLQRHVYFHHVNRNRLYECPHCDFSSDLDIRKVEKHMKQNHANTANLSPISNKEALKKKAAEMMPKCFPNVRNCSQDKNHNLKTSMIDVSMASVKSKICVKTESLDESLELNDMSKFETPAVAKRCKHKARVMPVTPAKHMTECNDCKKPLRVADRQVHIYEHHLNEARLFECSLCDYAHSSSLKQLFMHIKEEHKDSHAVPHSNVHKFSQRISELNNCCYFDWIHRPLGPKEKSFTKCKLCFENVRYTSRHIAEVHFKLPCYQCADCDYGNVQIEIVREHHVQKHPECDIKEHGPISITHVVDFDAVYEACFPGRPNRAALHLISAKKVHRAKCSRCGVVLGRSKFLSHVLQHHLDVQFIKCPFCAFSSNYDDNVVRQHIDALHSETRAPVLSLANFSEIFYCVSSCFRDATIDITEVSAYSYVS